MSKPYAGPALDNHAGVELQSVDAVMSMLQYRHEHRENHLVERVSHLGIRWHDQGPSKTESGYYAKIDGVDMLLTGQALRGANKLIRSNVAFWEQHQDRDAFPKTLSHILDNRAESELLIRTDGLKVNAILPSRYQVKDASEILADLIDPLRQNVGDIQGISMIDEGDGDITSLRIVIGENIVPSLKAQFGQYMMFLLNTSETGAIDSQTVMGLWRTSCSNSAIREEQLQRWDHKSEWDKFWDGTMQTVRDFSYFQPQLGAMFASLYATRLDIPASDLLRGFRTAKLISNAHYDSAANWVNQPTEDGRSVENQYDLFNVLTRAAQELPSIKQQHNAEQSAMKIFTQPGGIFKSLRDAHANRNSGGVADEGDELPN